jgi:hypothetical protein
MVFLINWDDSGLGFCCTGWNPLWPCPYMTEEFYPATLRVNDAAGEDDRFGVYKEPGPGPLACCFYTITPGILVLPYFLWKARAIAFEFRRAKDDRVHGIYRIKTLCWERKEKFTDIKTAWVDTTNVMENGKKRKSFALMLQHRDGDFRWNDMDLTNSRWRDQATTISEGINRLINSYPL